MIWVETPSNPLLKLIDLAAIAKIAREHDLIAVADNTFASPWIQRPLELGFDIVVHSATKYLNGHSDMIGGAWSIGGEASPCGARRAPGLSAKRRRRHHRSVRQLSRVAWAEDAGAAHGAALRQRARPRAAG